MTDSESAFSRLLQQARREVSLSQQELANLLTVHRTTVVRWESQASTPSPAQVETIAAALGKSREYFQGEFQEAEVVAEVKEPLDPWMLQVPLKQLQERTPEELRRLCREKRYSITEIAKKVGVPTAFIRDWIAQRRVPGVGDLRRLREAFGEDFDPTPMAEQRAPAKTQEEILSKILERLERLDSTVAELTAYVKDKMP